MALGSSDLIHFREFQSEIFKYIQPAYSQAAIGSIANGADSNLNSQLESFKKVVADLRGWADETMIGKDLEEKLIKINGCYEQLIEQLNELLIQFDKFVDEQNNINSGM